MFICIRVGICRIVLLRWGFKQFDIIELHNRLLPVCIAIVLVLYKQYLYTALYKSSTREKDIHDNTQYFILSP